MILTCEECQSQYTVPDDKISAEGRIVRCVKCEHTWLQMPSGAKKKVKAEIKEEENVQEAVTEEPAEEEPVFQEELNEEPIAEELIAEEDNIFQKEVIDENNLIDADSLPAHIITQKAFGVNSLAFGSLVFILLISLTLLLALTAQKPALHKLPQLALFYDKLGIKISAPGEGFQFSQMSAKYTGDENSGTLKLDGKITNISEHKLIFPDLYMVLKDGTGTKLQDWDLKSRSKEIDSEESSPLNFNLENISANGTTLEIMVQH